MNTILICFAAFCGLAFASDVLEFDDSSFDSEIGEHELILVEFYAPWCGHCKNLAPKYEEAATKLKASDPQVPLAKVDCDANKDLCSKFGVSGYPTLKIFREGEVASDYSGPRDADGIVSHMLKQAGPVSKELETAEDIGKFIEGDRAIVIGFFPEGGDAKAEFEKAANSLFEDFKFGFTSSADAAKAYDQTEDAVVLFRPPKLNSKMEDNSVKYDGPIKKFKLEKFIKDNANGLCGHLTSDNSDQFKKPLVTVYFDVDFKRNAKGTNYWRNRVMKVAKQQTEEIFFAVASTTDFSRELDEYGLDSEQKDKPQVTITGKKGEKYKMEEAFSVDNLAAFVTKFLAGEVEQYLKSEAVPESNDGPVKVVVAKTFDEIVNDDSKDVLIEFYAPWCGHCKNLEPKYKELGEKLSDDDNIVIAKMDATANDVPSPFQVSGFPTIYWAPAGGKDNPKKYQGGREVTDFLDYIKKEATNPVNIEEEEEEKKKKKKKKTEL